MSGALLPIVELSSPLSAQRHIYPTHHRLRLMIFFIHNKNRQENSPACSCCMKHTPCRTLYCGKGNSPGEFFSLGPACQVAFSSIRIISREFRMTLGIHISHRNTHGSVSGLLPRQRLSEQTRSCLVVLLSIERDRS